MQYDIAYVDGNPCVVEIRTRDECEKRETEAVTQNVFKTEHDSIVKQMMQCCCESKYG